jgi:hypothetical protein
MALTAAIYAKPRPSLVFVGSTFSAVDTDPYTFTAAGLGAPGHFRTIIVGIHCEDAATNYSISSVTVQGFTATQVVASANSPAIKAALYAVTVRSGWTGDVVVDFSEGITSCGISVWAAYNLDSNTAVATTTATADNTGMTVITKGDGIVIAAATNASNSDTCTWTGVTEAYDADATDIRMTGGSFIPTSGASVTATADFVTGTAVQAVAASFR